MLPVMSAPIRAKATAEMLRQLHGEDSRFELIHGEISEKALPRIEHARNQLSMAGPFIRRFNRNPGGKWPGGWWLMSELHVQYRDDEVFCHDLCGYRRDLHAELSNDWPCPTRPDWVCELLSPGHHKRDRVDKSAVLFRSKVPHYWIVDPEEKLLEIYRWTPEGYTLVRTAGPGETVRAEPFDAVELRTSVLFGDEDDDE